jgi:hypothetical protein
MQYLALQIGKIDCVVIDQRNRAYAGRRKVKRNRGTKTAGTDYKSMGGQYLFLAFNADFVQ